ncbi:MAG: hypothetical protein AAF772_12870 [Acidobacteriota bacterium]
MASAKSSDAQARLEASRRALEVRMNDVRRAFDRELGRPLQAKTWALPLAALGLGVALGALLAGGGRRSALPPGD